MTVQQMKAQAPDSSLDENLTDQERLALRSLLDAWAGKRRAAMQAEHDHSEWPLPLGTELAIAASIERHILEWATSMRHDAEGIEQRARERLAEIDEAMRQLNGEPLIP